MEIEILHQEDIIAFMVLPDGSRLFQGWGHYPRAWYTERIEALNSHLLYAEMDRNSYKRMCQGKRWAMKRVDQLKKAITEA